MSNINDIWELDYKSTSDEEDNDSSDEDEYGKVQYPKPRIQSEGSDPVPVKEEKKQEKKQSEDVIMKIIGKDRALIRRDLEARLQRIKRL